MLSMSDLSRSVLIILREHGAERPVDKTEHGSVGHGLDEEPGARREGEEETRSEDDEQNHRDEDICVEGGHL
jgi:hypothetical protein